MKVALTDFRAFASTGLLEVRPLTFLVGENSSGKTSFLAALSYIWRLQERMLLASFNAPPFDLGTFDEIVHRVRGRARPNSFNLEIEDNITVDPRRSPFFIFSREGVEKSTGLAKLSLTFINNVGDASIQMLNLTYSEYEMRIWTDSSIKVVTKKNGKVVFDSSEGQEQLKLGRHIGRIDSLDMSDLIFSFVAWCGTD